MINVVFGMFSWSKVVFTATCRSQKQKFCCGIS